MSKFLFWRAIVIAVLLCRFGVTAAEGQFAQPGAGGYHTFGRVTGTGPMGPRLNHAAAIGAPSSYTVEWHTDGTAAAVCTFQLEGSLDGIHWYALTGVIDGTVANMQHVAFKPVVYLRVNILTYTAGDGTTAITFNYTRGS